VVIAFTAVLLYILIAEFGGISASDSRWKILVLVAVTIVVERLAVAAAKGWLLSVVALAITTIALAAALVLWLKVARIAALKIAALFFSIRIAIGILLLWLFAAA
jgi:hypothetical protein